MCQWSWNVSMSGDYNLHGTWHKRQPTRLMVEHYKAKQTNYSEFGVFQVFCLQHALTHCAHYQEVKNSLHLFTAGQWNMTDEIYDILCNLKTYFCRAEWHKLQTQTCCCKCHTSTFQRENNFQTILLQTTPIFWSKHLQIVWHVWLHMWYKYLLHEVHDARRQQCDTTTTHNCTILNKNDARAWV